MKISKLLYVFAFLLLSNSVFSQKITLNDLIYMCNKKNWESVNQYIQNKGWEYYDSKRGDSEKYNTITWSFNKSYYDDKANAWFYLYTYEGFPNKVTYNVFNKKSYSAIKNSLSSKGFKLIKSEIEDDEIITEYSNSSFILRISTSKRERDSYSESSVTSYTFLLIKKAGIYDVDNGKKYLYFDFTNIIESEFNLKNGKLHGKIKVYHKNGKLKKTGNFINGVENGLFKEYDEDGDIKGEQYMKNGQLNGLYKNYYKSGHIKEVGTSLEDKKNGLIKEYLESGELFAEYSKVNGIYNGIVKIYEEGLLSQKYMTKNDEKDGSYEEFYYKNDTLRVRVKGQYSNGKKQGQWDRYLILNEKEELYDYLTYSKDVLNGKFRSSEGDSLIYGNYMNGKLHREYFVYFDALSFLFGSPLKLDSSIIALNTKGNYYLGEKSGKWEYYISLATKGDEQLAREGYYQADKKDGIWKYYYMNYTENGITLPFSSKLYLLETYKNGKLNGKSERFSFLKKDKYLCKNENNEEDTCIRNYVIYNHKLSNYKDGVLHGNYLLKDSTGNVLTKGDFNNGLKTGSWTHTYLYNNYKERHEGKYINDLADGEWNYYSIFNDKKSRFLTINFEKGKYNGKVISWKNNDLIKNISIYKKDKLIKYTAMNTTFSTPEIKFEIYEDIRYTFKCNYIQYYLNSDTTIEKEQVYTIKKDTFEINYYNIEDFVINKINHNKGFQKAYPDGRYSLYNNKGQLIETGNMFKDKKNGLWEYFYYDQNVRIELEYRNGIPGIEKYFYLEAERSNIFTGKFIKEDIDSKIIEERKIKNGIRDGVTKFIDANGKVIRKEKYKGGKLIH